MPRTATVAAGAANPGIVRQRAPARGERLGCEYYLADDVLDIGLGNVGFACDDDVAATIGAAFDAERDMRI